MWRAGGGLGDGEEIKSGGGKAATAIMMAWRHRRRLRRENYTE